MVTEGGYYDAGILGGFKECHAILRRDLLTVKL